MIRDRLSRRPGALLPGSTFARTWIALVWESAVPAFAPTLAVVLAFLVLALGGVLGRLPFWLHLPVLVAFVGAFGWTLYRGVRRLTVPTRHAVYRRLERDSGLDHRPLSTATDTQGTGTADPGSRDLWRRHRAMQAALLARLRVRPPRPRLAEADPRAVGGALALGLVVAVVAAGADWSHRLSGALVPAWPGAEARLQAHYDVYITPPAYTGRPPLFLETPPAEADPIPAGRIETALQVPQGSAILVRVTGGDEDPVLEIGTDRFALQAVDEAAWEYEGTIADGTRLALLQDEDTLGAWPIHVIPDAPPEIAFATPPGGTDNWQLRLDYTATDDYGVRRAEARIVLADGAPEALAGQDPITVPLNVPGRLPKQADGLSFHDLTRHPWTGLPVEITAVATDGADQTGESETVTLRLPLRQFTHPVARAIANQRLVLLRTPDQAAAVAETLETLSLRPDRYYDDRTVFLGLRTAFRRLRAAADDPRDLAAAIGPVESLLWELALRIDGGDLSLAEQTLRDAQQRLMEALADDSVTDDELRQLMEDLRQAMQDYMQALNEQLAQQMQQGELPQMPTPPDGSPSMNTQQLDDMLQQMLDQMQQMAETGARDAAREMLSQMQQMMQQLQQGQFAQMQTQTPMMDMLEQLQQLGEGQQQLLDHTFQQDQQQQSEDQQGSGGQGQQGQLGGQQQPQSQPGGGSPGGGTGEGMAMQEALRRALGDVMRQIGEMTGDIPEALGRAEQAMRSSEQALGQGQPGEAIGPQTRALDALQQGMQGFVDQMMEQMAQGQGQGQGQQPGQMLQQMLSEGQDPLGRPMPNAGGADTNSVDIPNQSELQRAREILQELRRRLGEHERPELELDYIERLLERF